MAKKIVLASEHQIQHACNELLQYSGWYVIRLNAGSIPLTDKNGNTRMIRLADPGTPDTVAFRPYPHRAGVLLLFPEYKRPGKKPTALQLAKMAELRRYGAMCVVIHSVEELQAVLVQLEREVA